MVVAAYYRASRLVWVRGVSESSAVEILFEVIK